METMILAERLSRPGKLLKSGLPKCSWCRSISDDNGKHEHSQLEIGGIDKLSGRPICRQCLDAALKIETLFFSGKGSLMKTA